MTPVRVFPDQDSLGAALADEIVEEFDPTSQRLVRELGSRMADYVRAAGRRVELDDDKQVVVAGGLLRSRGSLLADAIGGDLDDHVVSISTLEPALGGSPHGRGPE